MPRYEINWKQIYGDFQRVFYCEQLSKNSKIFQIPMQTTCPVISHTPIWELKNLEIGKGTENLVKCPLIWFTYIYQIIYQQQMQNIYTNFFYVITRPLYDNIHHGSG